MIQRKIRLTTIGPLIISAILIVVFSIIFVISSRAGSANNQAALDAVSRPILTTTSKLLFNPLYNLDITKANGILDPYVDGTTVIYAAVYDINGTQFVEINKKWAPDIALSRDLSIQALSQTDIAKKEVGDYLILTKSIAVGTVQIGTVEIAFDQAPLRASLGKAQATISVTLGIALIAITSLFFILFQYAVRPLNHLALVARDISRGNLSAEIPVEGTEEITFLASAFVALLGTVRNTIATLEERVTDRTKALATVAEVSTVAATILETDKLLQQVVDLTKERFNFYHAHIYLLNDAGDTLVLASGAGEVGRQMAAEKRSISLDREQSLVARAARERKGITVNDVTQTPDFLPNPLLPDTHSELAVPMIAGEKVIGVFDVQSEIVGRFTDADIAVQTTLSSQIAIAVQNAYQYEETRSALSQSERLFNASDRLSRALSLQEMIKAAVESLGIPAIDRAILGSLGYGAGDELDSMTIAANWSQSTELQATPVGTHYSKEMLSSLSMFTSSEPLFFDDMLNDERVDETTKAIARKVNYRSVAALPLFVGSRRDALILLEGQNPHNFTQDEIRLFTSLGPQLATILENRRQFERAREQAKREALLNAISQKIQSATTIESALQVTARELGHALGMKPTLVSLDPAAPTGEPKGN